MKSSRTPKLLTAALWIAALVSLPAWGIEVGDTLACTKLQNVYPDGSRSDMCITQPDNGLSFTLLEYASAQCQYCTQNIPFVSSFAAQIRSDATLRLVMIDRSAATIDQYVAKHRDAFVFPVAYDLQRAAFKTAHLQYTPTFLLLDQAGKVLFVQEGTLDDDGAAKIKELLRK